MTRSRELRRPRTATRSAGRLLLGLLAAPVLLAILGYVKLAMVRSILGVPAAWAPAESYLRAGASMVATTLAALPATVAALLIQPQWWFRVGLPGLALYLLIFAWCRRPSPLRSWVRERGGAAGSATLSALVGLVLLLLAARLLAEGQTALRVQGLLTSPPPERPEAVLRLEAIVRAGDAAHLTRRYVGFLAAWLAAAHLVFSFLRLRRWPEGTPVHRAVGRAAATAAAFLLVLSAACAPAGYALVRAASGFPEVRVLLAAEGQTEAVDGLLIEHLASWITVYETDPGRLRLLSAAEVREIRPGPPRPLFPLAGPGGAED